MKKHTCIIVDDSAIYRSQIRKAVEEIPDLDVIGVAENGLIGLDLVKKKSPSLIILDLEMPECDGMQTLKRLNQMNFTGQVLLFASPTKKSAEVTLEALELGAKDFIAKPSYKDQTPGVSPSEKIKAVLLPKVEGLLKGVSSKTVVTTSQSGGDYKPVNWRMFLPKVLVVGSSTGGPTALDNLFKMLKPPFSVPIVITQHMPPVFTATFAERLGRSVGVSSFEATDGMTLQPNHIYVAQGGRHMRLIKEGNKIKTNLFDGADINFIKPAVDPLFQSAAEIFGNRCLAMVLTGMGHDGYRGAMDVKNQGGCVLIQNKESCAVWGMPAAVHKEGCFDECLSLEGLADRLNNKISIAVNSAKRGVA